VWGWGVSEGRRPYRGRPQQMTVLLRVAQGGWHVL